MQNHIIETIFADISNAKQAKNLNQIKEKLQKFLLELGDEIEKIPNLVFLVKCYINFEKNMTLIFDQESLKERLFQTVSYRTI